jgi:ATP-dependent HslUV protease ATP-binding subunit HslU
VRERALDAAEERILDALLPPARHDATGRGTERDSDRAQVFRKKLREGELDEREIDIELSLPRRWASRSWRRPAWRR